MSSGRIDRSKKQRLYLLQYKALEEQFQFTVEGSSGNHYTVTFDEEFFSCTCPDYQHRFLPCKHLFFMAFRVFRKSTISVYLEGESPQGAFLEVQKYFGDLDQIDAKKSEKKEEAAVTAPSRNEDCVICFEPLEKEDAIVQCVNIHGLHEDCMSRWRRQGFAASSKCPMCKCAMLHEEKKEDEIDPEHDDALKKEKRRRTAEPE